jgi:selenide,water dikinase
LLVGLCHPDDAAAYRLDEDRVLLCTADFITPIVDDPYDFGYIAAANAMSDVYAMGGEVLLALNLLALPPALPDEVVGDILRGGADAVAEAGGVIAGGHTIDDNEPKYGLSVVGMVSPDELTTNAAARPGDVLVLSKPLGVGIITTAAVGEAAEAAHVEGAVAAMKVLNREASQALKRAGVRCVTDVTGFGILGHAADIALESGVQLRLRFDDLPCHEGAKQYAREWLFPAGACRNEQAYADRVSFESPLGDEYRTLLFTPETSGGLLAAVPPAGLERLQDTAAGRSFWVVGEVAEGEGVVVA